MRLTKTKEWINEHGQYEVQKDIIAFRHGYYGILMRPEMYFGDTDIRVGLREWIDDDKCQLMDDEFREVLGPILSSNEAEVLSEDEFGIFLCVKILEDDINK
jgi:hypothetical protein